MHVLELVPRALLCHWLSGGPGHHLGVDARADPCASMGLEEKRLQRRLQPQGRSHRPVSTAGHQLDLGRASTAWLLSWSGW